MSTGGATSLPTRSRGSALRQLREDEEDTDGDAAVGKVEHGEGPDLEEVRDHPIVNAIEEIGKSAPEDEAIAHDLLALLGMERCPEEEQDREGGKEEEEGKGETDAEGDAGILLKLETDEIAEKRHPIREGRFDEETEKGGEEETAEDGGEEEHA